ncbi:DUF3817 domain-containing protein [Actinoalloteichus hymeniacidonis]|uniref:Integral membrane protein n=1 Tax=Actinoalloteichus hymeniacidonis TaxID=340345 RepID=A0AAC9HRM3_9PSEU|nr:DUF3817 domain-containing protein [Actinoalloteichus hymeniacidonis]AOS64354.1 integral membrane protein [Actinoalloteichus hymeniacidonis]MBB5907578.1 integral membrane protein [Actinoalloteichus hymeniacidonis]
MTQVQNSPAPVVPSGTLLRYRVISYVVGVMLVALVLVAMPVRWLTGDPFLVALIGPLHGFLYMVYLLFCFDLSLKAKWSIKATILTLLAGTVPFLSFVAEHIVTRKVRDRVRI